MNAQTKIALSLIFALFGSVAAADILTPWKYIKRYQIGFDVGSTTDVVNIDYNSDSETATPEALCSDANTGEANMKSCTMTFEQSSSNFGLVLQQPFKRRGFWHLDWDISLGFRGLNGDFEPREEKKEDYESAPADNIEINLYSVYAYPYITFGITPKNWVPDILISVGPTGEGVFGSVKMNDEEYKNTGVFRRSGVMQFFSYNSLEIVFRRFGKGYFSLFASNYFNNGEVEQGRIIPREIDKMEEVRFSFNRNFMGFKVVLK